MSGFFENYYCYMKFNLILIKIIILKIKCTNKLKKIILLKILYFQINKQMHFYYFLYF